MQGRAGEFPRRSLGCLTGKKYISGENGFDGAVIKPDDQMPLRVKVEKRAGDLVIRKPYGDLLTEMRRPRKPGFPDFAKSLP